MTHAYEVRPIAGLVAFARNARTHSPEQVAQLAASIRAWGFTNPVLIEPDGSVIAGHGRLLAAAELGLLEVPCIVVAGLSAESKAALVLADNQLAANAGWDEDLLRAELESLLSAGFDLSLTGFSDQQLEQLLHPEGREGLTDPDDAPGLPVEARAQPGQVWVCGAHRVMCGDATSLADVERVCAGPVDLVWTDPPYNVDYQAEGHPAFANDSLSTSAFVSMLEQAFACMAAVMRPGSAIYVAHADAGASGVAFQQTFRAAGFHLSGVLIWRKQALALVLGRSDYQRIHEPVLYGWKPGARHRWYGGRKQTTFAELPDGLRLADDGSDATAASDSETRAHMARSLILTLGARVFVLEGVGSVFELPSSVHSCPRPKKSVEHPTMKPVELIERHLKNSALPGEVVLDPFGGSGSTLIAAERMGMGARVLELDPRYVDVIVGRWEGYTGRLAVAEVGGSGASCEDAGVVAEVL